MKILNCHINGFGCFENADFSFEEGLNTICRKNGFGKTTLAVFIKAMLYGLPATKKQDVKENERKHYKPWRTGAYGGSLELETEGRRYRIERSFGAKEKSDSFTVYDLATGKQTDALGDCPGVTLFEIDAEGFERSVYISQREPHARLNTPTIQSKLGALIEDSEDLGDYQGAESLLLQRARSYKTTGERGSVYEQKRALSAKEAEIAACQDAALQAASLREAIADEEKAKAKAQDALRAIREENGLRRQRNEALRLRKDAARDHARLSEALRLAEEKRTELLAFFGGEVPSEKAIQEIEDALTAYEAAKAKQSATVFSEEKQSRLSALREKYRAQPLTRSLLSGFREEWGLLEHKERTLSLSKPQESEALSIGAIRYQGLTEERAAEIAALANACDTDTAPRRSPFFPIGIIGAAVAAALGALFFILSLTLPAICALALFVGFSALAALTATGQGNGRGADLEALARLLSPFGVTPPTPLEAKLFLAGYDRYKAEKGAYDGKATEYEAACSAFTEQRTAFAAALAPYGEGEPAALLAMLEADLVALEGLELEEKEIKERLAEAEAALALQNDRLARLLAPFPADTLSYRALCGELSAKKTLLAEAEQQIKEAGEALAAFRAQKGFTEAEAVDAEEEPLLDEGEALSIIDSLTASIAAKDKEATVLEERAFPLHIRIEEKKQIEAQIAEEEEIFSALEEARRFLTDAKEALSTRYLSGMEESFRTRMEALSYSPVAYHFDTELSLSAEKDGARRQTELLSAGEADLALFCARIALVDTIFTREAPVLILDDPFVNLDGENLARAHTLLESLSRDMQILYFVCRE